MISKDRQKLYDDLESKIGNTKLIKYEREVPNENTIWIKRECDNPFGSHYDRVYFELIKFFEEKGKITPGQKLLETSSGTAAASFAGVARALGYIPYAVIPEGVDNAIKEAITDFGGIIKAETQMYLDEPEKDYVNGFKDWLEKFFQTAESKEFFFLNHSMGRRIDEKSFHDNKITLGALKPIGTEIIEQLKEKGQSVDYYLPAVGNGSSILGPGPALKDAGAKIITFETVQSAVMYGKLYGDEKYIKEFGIKPGILPRHKLRGTSFRGINFPHIEHAVERNLVDKAVLLSDSEIDHNYFVKTGKNTTEKLPHWDSIDYKDLGRSGNAGIVTALELAKRNDIKNKNFVIIAYDNKDRYDEFKPLQ